ncbi:unnamed protein product, partial [marine sediment metagenome]
QELLLKEKGQKEKVLEIVEKKIERVFALLLLNFHFPLII